MKDFVVLKFLDKISSLIKLAGIDYPMMRKIIQIKLIIDGRRVPSIMLRENKIDDQNSFALSLLMYAVMGIVVGMFMLMPFPLFLKMNIITGMLIFLIMTIMISDFSSVLLDVDDKIILLPRPIEGKTINAAKLIHIIIYLFGVSISIAGGSLILGTIRYGALFFLMFVFEIVLICGFVILITSIFYYIILAVFSDEKLKDIINYFQIILTICMTLMYQIIGRVFHISMLNAGFIPHCWNVLLPSAWFAAPFMLFLEHNFNMYYVIFSIVGIIIPIITMTLYIKVVAPRFEMNLQKLKNSGSSRKKNIKKESFHWIISNIICHNPIEKVFFRFTLQMLDNERKLKLQLYPSLVFSVIFPFIIFLNFYSGEHTFLDTFALITQGRGYLYLYFTIAFMTPLFMMIRLSENYKGAWIYRALPIDNPAMVIKGAFKGFLYKYIVPIYLCMSLIFLAVFGLKIVLDLILIFLNMLLLMLIIFFFSNKELPFYKNAQYTQNGNNTVIIFISFALCGCAAGLHYMDLVIIPFGVAINIGIVLMAIVILWRRSFKISWKDIMETAR